MKNNPGFARQPGIQMTRGPSVEGPRKTAHAGAAAATSQANTGGRLSRGRNTSTQRNAPFATSN